MCTYTLTYNTCCQSLSSTPWPDIPPDPAIPCDFYTARLAAFHCSHRLCSTATSVPRLPLQPRIQELCLPQPSPLSSHPPAVVALSPTAAYAAQHLQQRQGALCASFQPQGVRPPLPCERDWTNTVDILHAPSKRRPCPRCGAIDPQIGRCADHRDVMRTLGGRWLGFRCAAWDEGEWESWFDDVDTKGRRRRGRCGKPFEVKECASGAGAMSRINASGVGRGAGSSEDRIFHGPSSSTGDVGVGLSQIMNDYRLARKSSIYTGLSTSATSGRSSGHTKTVSEPLGEIGDRLDHLAAQHDVEYDFEAEERNLERELEREHLQGRVRTAWNGQVVTRPVLRTHVSASPKLRSIYEDESDIPGRADSTVLALPHTRLRVDSEGGAKHQQQKGQRISSEYPSDKAAAEKSNDKMRQSQKRQRRPDAIGSSPLSEVTVHQRPRIDDDNTAAGLWRDDTQPRARASPWTPTRGSASHPQPPATAAQASITIDTELGPDPPKTSRDDKQKIWWTHHLAYERQCDAKTQFADVWAREREKRDLDRRQGDLLRERELEAVRGWERARSAGRAGRAVETECAV